MMEEKVLINGLQINYRIAGEGQPFLILHGWGSRADRWRVVGELLSERGIKVIIPDLPGFGESQIPSRAWSLNDYSNFVDDFTESIKLKKFYLLGHSFGGSLAIKYALKFPEKIKKLFLVAPSCVRKDNQKKQILGKIAKSSKIFSFLPFYSLAKRAFYKFIVRKSDYLSTKGTMRETYLKIIKEDFSNVLLRVKAPTILIWGDKDDVIPLEQAFLIQKKIKNSKLEIIPEGAHDIERFLPDPLSRKILENLKEAGFELSSD